MRGAGGAPVAGVGPGSSAQGSWGDPSAPADIVAYGGVPSVKKGREFLLRKE